MELKRVGVLLFGIGLCLSLLSAVAFGFVSGSTEAFCADHDPSYSLEAVDVATLDITYSDGCNNKSINSLVTAGLLVSLTGLAVGGGGVLRELSAAD